MASQGLTFTATSLPRHIVAKQLPKPPLPCGSNEPVRSDKLSWTGRLAARVVSLMWSARSTKCSANS